MSKVGNLGLGKRTLGQVNFALINLQQLQHRVEMVEMTLNKNVIEKH
jgi:hypothetical protein